MARRARRRTRGIAETIPTPKRLTRREREASHLRRVWLAIGVVGILVIGVLGFGVFQEFVAKPNAPVAMVAGVPIKMSTYHRMVRYEQWRLQLQAVELQQRQTQLASEAEGQEFITQYLNQQLEQIQSMIPQVPYQTVRKLIEDELVRQEARRRGITVDDEALRQAIEEQFGYYRIPPTPTPITETLSIATPLPTPVPMTLDRFQEDYKSYTEVIKKQTGIPEAALREVFRIALLRQKLQEAMAAEVPTEAEQVHARHILVESEEEAQQVRERLDGGEPFELLAQELSTDESNKSDGGDLGWFPRGQMVPEFEEAAFDTKVGDIVGPVQTSFGWHLIKVEGHEVRELTPGMLQQQQSQALQNWLSKAALGEGVENLWTSEMVPPTEASGLPSR